MGNILGILSLLLLLIEREATYYMVKDKCGEGPVNKFKSEFSKVFEKKFSLILGWF